MAAALTSPLPPLTASNRSRGQLTSVAKYAGSGALTYRRDQSYDSLGRLAAQTVQVGSGGTWTTGYRYDAYSRLATTVYPDGEQVAVGYGAMGLPVKLTSSNGYDLVNGVTADGGYADAVQYDGAGRLVGARYGGSGSCTEGIGGLWVAQRYYPWVSADGNGNGRYAGVTVGGMPGWTNVLTTTYRYDSHGNPVQYATGQGEQLKPTFGSTFDYDDQNRVTSGYGENFTWTKDGLLSTLNGVQVDYNPMTSTHAIDKIGGVDYYDYDLNGSMFVRYKGKGWKQQLKWDSHNRLAQMTGSGVSEGYRYDETGGRIRKTNLLTGGYTDYLFPGYERASSGVVTKHYSFGGVPVAVRTGSASPALLYGDGVQSTVYSTNLAGTVTSATSYRVFGGTRLSEGSIPTDRRYTGQREDATGLYYMNARYYDPQIGHFISPDTVVPDENNFLSYNRYLYANGNPLKYNDPSGHCSNEVPSSDNAEAMQAYTECWQLAGVILMLYNNDPWWQERFEVDQQTFFEKAVMQPTQDARWMREQLDAWEYDFKLRTGQQVGRVDWYESPEFSFPEAEIMGLFEGKGACEVWDCHAIGLDFAALGIQISRDTALMTTPATNIAGLSGFSMGQLANGTVTTMSLAYVTGQATNGNASAADLVVAYGGVGLSYVPVAGEFASVGQLIWDLLDPFHPW